MEKNIIKTETELLTQNRKTLDIDKFNKYIIKKIKQTNYCSNFMKI